MSRAGRLWFNSPPAARRDERLGAAEQVDSARRKSTRLPLRSRLELPAIMDQYITTYGYLAVLLGVSLEGEIIVAAAGFFAWRGLLNLYLVIAVAATASVLTYQVYFWMGRHHGRRYLARHPDWQPRVAKIQRLLHRHHLWVILGYRLLFGLRGVTPFALGLSGVSQLRFLLLDIFPAVTWAVGVTLAGYLFGPAARSMFASVGRVQVIVVAVVLAGAVAGLVYWWYTTIRRRR